ncbi:MAG: M16 family metallopeptidase, partial [Elusimicrobiota bacterium]
MKNITENIKTGNLKNGMEYVIWEDKTSDVVEMRLYVKTGSIYEKNYYGSGISHFLEHITAEGPTGKSSKKEIDRKIEKFGNRFNAYTTKDHTGYYITTISKFYPQALGVLGELVFENEITREAYTRERGVITREIEKALEEPAKSLYRLTSENLYRIHPTRYPVLGYTDLFKRISFKNLKDYYEKNYVPNNSVLVIGGNVDSEEVLSNIEEKYGNYKRNFHSLPDLPREPDLAGIREKSKVMDIEGQYLNLSWLTIPLDHSHLYALDILSEILSSGKNARLNRIVKEEKELVNSIDSYSYTPSFGKGQFTVKAKLTGEKRKKVEQAILEIILDIQKNGITDKELKRAKKLSVSENLFRKTTVSNYTSRIGIDALSTGDPNFTDRYVEKLRKVTPEKVKEAANKYLDISKYTRTFITGRPAEEKSSAEEKTKEYEVQKKVLDNGVTVVAKKIPGISVINYSLFLKGGLTYDKIYDTPGLFNFTASMLGRGTKKYNRRELNEEFEKRGASFSTSSGNNSFYVKASSLAEDYEKIIELLKEILYNPSFDTEEIEKQKKFTLNSIRQFKNNWQKEAMLNFKKNIFPSSMPYIYDKMGTTESVKNIDRKAIQKVHEDFTGPQNLVISLAGDFNPDEIIKKVESEFSKVKESEKELPDYDGEFLNLDRPVKKQYKTAKQMGVIFKGFPTVTVFDTKVKPVLDVIDTLISGKNYPGGWLHERLRGDELVYVTHAYNQNYIKSGSFTIFAATNPQKIKEALAVIEGVIDDLKAAKYTDEEIKRAKEQIITAE